MDLVISISTDDRSFFAFKQCVVCCSSHQVSTCQTSPSELVISTKNNPTYINWTFVRRCYCILGVNEACRVFLTNDKRNNGLCCLEIAAKVKCLAYIYSANFTIHVE